MVALYPLRRFLLHLLVVVTAAGATIVAMGAHADTSQDILLSITTPETVRDFTQSDLEGIGIASFETATIWTDGVQEFTGTPLVALVAELGLQDGVLRAIAANDYAIDIPVSDAVEGGPIIAFLRNGQPMSLRDNGPLWVVYPYDDNPDYRSEIIHSRSIWQLERIVVVAP